MILLQFLIKWMAFEYSTYSKQFDFFVKYVDFDNKEQLPLFQARGIAWNISVVSKRLNGSELNFPCFYFYLIR